MSKPLDKKDPPTITVADIKAAIEALDIVKQYGNLLFTNFVVLCECD